MIKDFMNRKRKAQVFLMSSLILAGTAALGLSLVSVYLKNLKMVYEISESTRAFYAADACAEWRLNEVMNTPNEDKPVFSNTHKSLINCDYDPNYEADNQIKAIGITNTVRRGINIYFDASGELLNY